MTDGVHVSDEKGLHLTYGDDADRLDVAVAAADTFRSTLCRPART